MRTESRKWGPVLLTAGTAFLAGAGSALARPDTRAMSCAEAQALVGRNGAIVLTTGTHTYDRFVADGRYCDIPYIPQLTYVPTRDTRQCPIGYTCRQNSDDPGGMFMR